MQRSPHLLLSFAMIVCKFLCRRLSIGISLIGNPKIWILDEPAVSSYNIECAHPDCFMFVCELTRGCHAIYLCHLAVCGSQTGLSPELRRDIWSIVSAQRQAGRCILLSTHG